MMISTDKTIQPMKKRTPTEKKLLKRSKHHEQKEQEKTIKRKICPLRLNLYRTVMVAGTTFAWFTSEDTVVNRLTASNDYGMAIHENFTPPTDWVPGQTIRKEVTVINTGNIDGLARLFMSAEFNLVVKNTENSVLVNTVDPANITNTTPDRPSITVGGNEYYLKVLDTLAQKNEVESLQAGGMLVCIPSDAGYQVLQDPKKIGTKENVPNVYGNNATGLYLFRRSVDNAETEADTT